MNPLPNKKGAMVAVVGKPNVGKSTLINSLLGKKISITSKRAQTTRRRVMGLGLFKGSLQLAFFDTPGLHLGQDRVINSTMNQQASQSLDFADIVLWVITAGVLKKQDFYILELLSKVRVPTILVVNKIDRINPANKLLPLISSLQQEIEPFKPSDIIPVSALNKNNTDRLIDILDNYAPHKEHLFSGGIETDQPQNFFLAEIIREKIIRLCGMEIPHQLGVIIEAIEDKGKHLRINGAIQVEQKGQKAIVIGEGGSRIKLAGTQARKDMEELLNRKIMLSLWVKVKPNWSNNYASLQEMGYAGQEI